jgi:hypothetical protein
MTTLESIEQTHSAASPIAAGTEARHAGKEEGLDQFDPARLRVDARMSDAALGVERPLLEVPVQKPSRQAFFRVHPDPDMRMDAAVIELEAERETYLVTPQIACLIPEETKLVRLLACLPRTGGSPCAARARVSSWTAPACVVSCEPATARSSSDKRSRTAASARALNVPRASTPPS